MRRCLRTVAWLAIFVLLTTLISVRQVDANAFEFGRTSVDNIMTCGPRGVMWSQSRALGDCLSDNSGGRARIYCDSVDQPISAGAFVNGSHSQGPVRIAVGEFDISIAREGVGQPFFSARARIQPGQDDPRDAGGLSQPVKFPKLDVGTYTVRARYTGGTQWHDHGHPVVIVWPPAETTRTVNIVDCSSLIKTTPIDNDGITTIKLESGSCPEGIFHVWKAADRTNSELGRFYGCSVVIRSSYEGRRVETLQLERSAFPKHPSIVRRPLVEKCPIKTGTIPNLEDMDWSKWGEPAKLDLKRKLFAQWRRTHPAGTAPGSAAAFRAYAELVNSFLDRGAPPAVELNAAWQALSLIDQEVRALGPVLYDTVRCSLSTRSATQALDTAVAILGGVVEGGTTFLNGLSMATAMLVNNPQQLYDSVALWVSVANQKDWSELVVMASDFGIEMTKEQATAFLDTISQINESALKGDDKKIAEIMGKMAGQKIFDEVLSLGAAKAAAKGLDGLKKLSPRAIKAFDEAADRLRPGIRRSDALRSREIWVRDMNKYGFDPFRAQELDAVARETNTLLEFQSSSPFGLECIERGDCIPKPEGVKQKSVVPEDYKIGAPPGSEGKVWVGKPVDPGADAPPNVRENFSRKLEAYEKNKDIIEYLKIHPDDRASIPLPKGMEPEWAFRYENGKKKHLWVKTDDDGILLDRLSGRAIGPDNDLWAIRDRTTGELVEPARAREVARRLGGIANIQHGFESGGTALWNGPQGVRQDLFDKFSRTRNGNGTDVIVQFGAGNSGLPRTTFADLRESNDYLNRHYPGR